MGKNIWNYTNFWVYIYYYEIASQALWKMLFKYTKKVLNMQKCLNLY